MFVLYNGLTNTRGTIPNENYINALSSVAYIKLVRYSCLGQEVLLRNVELIFNDVRAYDAGTQGQMQRHFSHVYTLFVKCKI